jgi:predicted ribosome quality control (RQC) complex YloA/Tae2 family protein
VARSPPTPELTSEQRARLLDGVRALAGATVQKVWLPSASVAVLQLRVPGRTALAVVDARLALCAVVPERPTSPDSAPRSQATLRAALEGGRLTFARLERAHGGKIAARLSFETAAGARALIVGDGPALLLVAVDSTGERIVWAAAGAGPERRPGAAYPEAEPFAAAEARAAPSATWADADLVRRALEAEENAGVAARRRELVKRLRARAQRLRRTLSAVDEDAARAAQAKEDARRAELLVPHQSRIARGTSEALVPDWTDLDERGAPRQVAVQLDPTLSAAENAARWFRRSQRYQAASARIASRRSEVSAVLARAEALLARASSAADAAALRAVEEESAALLTRASAAPRPRDAPRLPYRAFRSANGARILVGRSARDNDALTLHVARGNDVWLHARGVQGSHVVIPDAGPAPDARTLGDAALLAAHFSRARGDQAAEVAWTRRKHVRKPKGAAPGSVIATQERTLRVRLDAARLAELLSTEE